MASQPNEVLPPGLAVQVPTLGYLKKMKGMPAGLSDDQQSRLMKVRKSVVKTASTSDFIKIDTAKDYDSDHINMPEWQTLFKLITQGNESDAIDYFNEEMSKDILYKALLTAHDQAYLEKLITHCCKAKIRDIALPKQDILITNTTFEILMTDLIALITHRRQMTFSCGLPTHHAEKDQGSGFCSLNKLAVLMAYDNLLDRIELHPLVIGTDVNQDNGLHDILFNQFGRTVKTTHIDIFDSRVYPWPKMNGYEESSRYGITEKTQRTGGDYKVYHAIDLADNPRPSSQAIHPIINYLIINTTSQIYEAKKQGKKLALYIPIGWDSHQGEIAPCGTKVTTEDSSRYLSKAEKLSIRFNDNDMQALYNFLQQLIEKYADDIHSITLFLEGGYTDEVLLTQVPQLLTTLAPEKQLTLSNSQASQYPAPKKHSYNLRKGTIETSLATDHDPTNNPYSEQNNKNSKI